MSIYSGYQFLTPKKNSVTVLTEFKEVPWLTEAVAEYKPSLNSMACEMYVLNFYVDFPNREFYGDVIIHVNLKKISQHIVLDKGRCEVIGVRLRRENDCINIDQVYDYVPQQTLVISLCRKLIPAKYKIMMAVKGQLSDKPEGFFLIHHSNDRLFALTHLWPDHAKHIFPCFNDPSFKSVFIVSLVRQSSGNFMAFSNMGIEKRIVDYPNEKLTTVYFVATPPIQIMSLSMIIGNFVTSEPILSKLGYTISVVCREEMINRTKEVLEMVCTIMSHVGKYSRTQFNLSKIHIVAVPMTIFPAYCTGYPGILIFSEHEICSVSDKTCLYYTRVVRKLIHEVIHVWLGSLFACSSWDVYQIFEGSIGHLSSIIGNLMFPSWFTVSILINCVIYTNKLLSKFMNIGQCSRPPLILVK